MSYLLEINDLSGGYGKEAIVKDISLRINQGDFMGIIGPNGSGKTTLLRLASKILSATKGNIVFQGRDIASMPMKELARSVAFVAQDTMVNFPFSVFEIVLMGRTPHLKRLEVETRKDYSIADDAMAMTDTLHLKDKKIDEISSGERQRVVIARALAQEPRLLLLDEPTSHLDIGHQIQVLDLLRRLNRKDSLTIAMVLHDLNLAGEYCNRITLLNDGGIFREGSPAEVLTYQNIEAVYKTVVVVNNNPLNSKPYVLLVPKEK
jgi:iron complex transport system ATP-binding protein